MTLRRYTPTDSGWLVFSANDALLLVVKPNDLSVVEQLWQAVRGGAQATLDELTRSGFSAAPSFALIEWNPAAEGASAPLRAIVRGEVVVTVSTAGGARRLDGAEASTWSEQLIDGASAFDLSTGAEPAETTLPFIAGVVMASRVSAGIGAAGDSAPVTSAVADVAIASVVPADAAAATATPEPAAVAVPAEAPSPAEVAAAKVAEVVAEAKKAAPKKAAPKVSPSSGPELGDTRVVESTVVAGASLESHTIADDAESEADGYDYLFGATVHRGVSDAAMSEAPGEGEAEAEAPAPSAAGDHDGHTIMSGDLRKVRGSRKTALPGSAAPAASVPILLLSTGGREPLTQPIIVGRAPAAAKVSGDQLPRLVTIPGDQDISRSHVRFALEGDTVVVTDLHSRNGTLIVMPGASPQQLRQGEPTAVIVGTVIDLGGGVTLTVHEDK